MDENKDMAHELVKEGSKNEGLFNESAIEMASMGKKKMDSNPNDGADSITVEEEKEKNTTISLKDRSEEFITIIESALKYEEIFRERNSLKSKNKKLFEDCKKLSGDCKKLSGDYKKLSEDYKKLSKCLAEKEKENKKQADEITRLKTDVEHRNEVIDIVKADKSESSQEYKNALAASLRTYHGDYMELKKMEMSADVGEAMSVTLEGVFAMLEKNGIVIG